MRSELQKRTQWICVAFLISSCIFASGCATTSSMPTAGVPVYSVDDSKLLAAFESSTSQEAEQTEILREIAAGQRELFQQVGNSFSADTPTLIQTSISDSDSKEGGLSLQEVPGLVKQKYDDALPDFSGESESGNSNTEPETKTESEWPGGVRIQVWKDSSTECSEWVSTEVPLLGVVPEYFNAASPLALKYGVKSFTIMLVNSAGNIDQTLTAPFSAGQIKEFAKETAGRSLGKVAMAGGSVRSCSCYNCECRLSSNQQPAIVQTSRSSTISRPVQSRYSIRTYSRPTQTKVRCQGGKCYRY